MKVILAIALGGALGALGRYGVMVLSYRAAPAAAFPWGTLIVNVTGSLFLGVLLRLLEEQAAGSVAHAFVVVGLAGAFTTFSTFSYDALVLLQAREYARALLYAGGSVVLGLAAVSVGFATAALAVRG